jgi:trehalose 6-phosphate phosphatase
VEDPTAARAVDGAVDALERLAGRYAVVAVISGRPATFLQANLPAALDLLGLYGLERVTGGRVAASPEAERWRTVVDQVFADASAQLQQVEVEHKGLSMTLHFRSSADHAAAADEALAFARRAAAATGLAVRPARKSVELHPPIAVDKGTVLTSLAQGLDAACFIGDDAGDLPAFDALDALEAQGLAVARVAVRSAEAPAGLLERADVVVDSPTGVVALLRSL